MSFYKLTSVPPGLHIDTAAKGLLALAQVWNEEVSAAFNDTALIARPDDSVKDILGRWDALRLAPSKVST